MPDPPEPIRVTPIKNGWAAYGPGWAVHGATPEEATRLYHEAVVHRAAIRARPWWPGIHEGAPEPTGAPPLGSDSPEV